ncbi:unnamed protein product, partial [Ectocarpus sp. 12 AP-2014]
MSSTVPQISAEQPTTESARATWRLRFSLLVICGLLASAVPFAKGAEECAAATNGCKEDADCSECLTIETLPTTCAPIATTCAEWWVMTCCLYGNSDACQENELLLNHLQCLAEGNDCAIDAVCPTLVDNGDEINNDIDGVADSSMELPWANGPEDGLACTDELAACMNESECSGCIPAVLPEGCPAGSDAGITCD